MKDLEWELGHWMGRAEVAEETLRRCLALLRGPETHITKARLRMVLRGDDLPTEPCS